MGRNNMENFIDAVKAISTLAETMTAAGKRIARIYIWKEWRAKELKRRQKIETWTGRKVGYIGYAKDIHGTGKRNR